MRRRISTSGGLMFSGSASSSHSLSPADLTRENNVPLPDEYDSIRSNLRLFYAHAPIDLKRRVRITAALPDTYVLVNTGGKVSVKRNFDSLKHPGGEARIAAQVALLEPVAKWLDDFEAVWSVHDTGRIDTSWSQRLEMERAVAYGSCKSCRLR